MSEKNKKLLDAFFAILLGVLAIFMIKSIFENDNSKIVSKKGRRFLSDDKKMKEINDKISASEEDNNHNEVLV